MPKEERAIVLQSPLWKGKQAKVYDGRNGTNFHLLFWHLDTRNFVMIVKSPHLLTKIKIWFPKYSSAYTDIQERVALLAKYKVEHATPYVLVEFTDAKHLMGQRFGILRETIVGCPVVTNGKIECYEVPMSYFENWQTASEVREIAEALFE